ncbi:MAG: phosphomannomutase/phosphoglucomutase, partial [Gammaproteobacteria bacterium]
VAEFEGGTVVTIDGLRVDWTHGWGLVRPSNTTPVLVFRFEAESTEALGQVQAVFREQLRRVDSGIELPF